MSLANTPERGRSKGFGTERAETPPPAGPGAGERRGGTERGQPGLQPTWHATCAVQVPARREAEKSADNPAPINLQLRRLPVQVRAKREADHREGKVPMVSLPGSQRVDAAPAAAEQGQGKPAKEKRRGDSTAEAIIILLIFVAAPSENRAVFR